MRQVCIQAKDGKWNYGPLIEEQIMRELQTGAYKTIWETKDALLIQATKEWRLIIDEELLPQHDMPFSGSMEYKD